MQPTTRAFPIPLTNQAMVLQCGNQPNCGISQLMSHIVRDDTHGYHNSNNIVRSFSIQFAVNSFSFNTISPHAVAAIFGSNKQFKFTSQIQPGFAVTTATKFETVYPLTVAAIVKSRRVFSLILPNAKQDDLKDFFHRLKRIDSALHKPAIFQLFSMSNYVEQVKEIILHLQYNNEKDSLRTFKQLTNSFYQEQSEHSEAVVTHISVYVSVKALAELILGYSLTPSLPPEIEALYPIC
jgi:hypothetical protein